MWLGFGGTWWKPNAVQVGVGEINVVSGSPWTERLADTAQNYLVTPDQPWLDGINTGAGVIRQFVALPLGSGHTVEGQLTGAERVGGIQIRVFEPKPGRFPDEITESEPCPDGRPRAAAAAQMMGLGAGGIMRQHIYSDAYGLDAWDTTNVGEIYVHILNGVDFYSITGRQPPSSPIDADLYTRYGFPWFEVFDEHRSDLAPSERLQAVKTVGQLQDGKPEVSVDVDRRQIRKIRPSHD